MTVKDAIVPWARGGTNTRQDPFTNNQPIVSVAQSSDAGDGTDREILAG